MRVSIALTAEEYRARLRAEIAASAGYPGGIRIARWGGGITGVLAVCAIGVLASGFSDGERPSVSVLVAFGFLGLSIVTYAGSVAMARRRMTQNLLAERNELPYTLELRSNCLLVENAASRTEIFWSAVRGVRITTECVVVLVRPTGTLLVPVRCFRSPDEYTAFVAELKSRVPGPYLEQA